MFEHVQALSLVGPSAEDEPEVALVDTALGRYKQNKLVEAKKLLQGLSVEEKRMLLGLE